MHTRTLKGFISLCCIFSILSNSIIPGLFASVPVLAEAPPPVSLAPAVRSSEVAITESLPTKAMPTPVPSDLFPEAEAARVRQAMETTLAKYRQYYGPRLSLMLDEVEITGEWAHAVVATGETKGATSLPATLHLLARRLPDGEWHALLPDGDDLYRQWAQAVPTKLDRKSVV